MQRNLPSQFTDVPVLQMQDNMAADEVDERKKVWAEMHAKMSAGVGNRETETHLNETAVAFARTYVLIEIVTHFKKLRTKVLEMGKK